MKTKFLILGCGSSLGIPRIDGYFGKCDPENKRNYRSRCSALISTKNINILIDTSPDIKNQLLKHKVKNINKVFYTHPHGDQTHGINELRVFYLKTNQKIPVYANLQTRKYLSKSFEYCFKNSKSYPATLELKRLNKLHYLTHKKNKVLKVRSIKVKHGYIDSTCYVINDKCAYVPDVSKIFLKDLKYLVNLDYLVIDCLRYKPHPSHFNLDDVLQLVKKISPKKTILTNLNNEIDYSQIKKKLPKSIIPAYDGLSFNF
tara:strand:+ start:1243 stop:2019 length:777 start_codon:yes stop_codon:yes gene_type:complete